MDELLQKAGARGVPEHLVDGLAGYIAEGYPVGSYLEALLSNDLRGVFTRGDDEALAGLHSTMMFLYNDCPSVCWGAPSKVQAWFERGGARGRESVT